MKRNLLILLIAATTSVFAEPLPSATQILESVRAQLPVRPVAMSGLLKEQAANGFVKKTLSVEMHLDWNAFPSTATYQIRDLKTDLHQTLEIKWLPEGPAFIYKENGTPVAGFDPSNEISETGVTWSDLSFSFLWSPQAETLALEKKFGKERYEISIPRPDDKKIILWVEKESGRLKQAEEYDADGKRIKVIKVVSIKEFDGLWMVKDLDIVRLDPERHTRLIIDSVD